MEELTDQFVCEQRAFQDDDPERRTIIGELESGTIIKGRARRDQLQYGMTYRFIGRWVEHPKWGRQFHFDSFVVSSPAGERATVHYLQRCPGFGLRRAQQAWNLWGDSAVKTVRNEPEKVAAEIPGLTIEAARAAAAHLESNAALEETTLALTGLFAKRGFPRTMVEKCIERWGAEAPEKVKADPYLLIGFPGVRFLRADSLYLELGHDPAAIRRQAYCVWAMIEGSIQGHTWFAHADCRAELARLVTAERLDFEAALDWGVEYNLLTSRLQGSVLYWSSVPIARAEASIANAVYEAETLGGQTHWPDPAAIEGLSEHQRAELAKALAGRIGILAGSPGTGKTWTLAHLIKTMGAGRIAVCAPTGKAAVRVTENLAGMGVNLAATTMHRLLGPAGVEDGEWQFEHGAGNPLPFDYLFVDECSMVDNGLLAVFLAARRHSTHVLLVGDPDQLSPVGRGAPLRDLIKAGLPCGHLKEIQRNAGRIVRCCAEIRDHHRATFSPEQRLPEENLVLVEAADPDRQIAMLREILGQQEELCLGPVANEVQVVVPVNDKSPLGRKPLNKLLQGWLNPDGEGVKTHPFRLDDKVICLKNGQYDGAPPDELEILEARRRRGDLGTVYVANGEQGVVIDIMDWGFVAELDAPARYVWVPVRRPNGDRDPDSEEKSDEKGAGGDWDLAYAISVHKAQGSDWPVVVVMVDGYGGARRLCDRHWVYTAISRAKEVCYLIGQARHVQEAVRKSHMWARKTLLVETVHELRTERLFLSIGEELGHATTFAGEEQANCLDSGEPECGRAAGIV